MSTGYPYQILNFFRNLLGGRERIDTSGKEPESKYNKSQQPIRAGRSSKAEQQLLGQSGYNVVNNRYYDDKTIELIEHLVICNRHMSLAADNIVTLGHTTPTLKLSDEFSDRDKRLMKEHLERVQSCWYSFNQNETMLDAQRFLQAATYGAVSTEAEILSSLAGINTVHLVTPRYIRFRWDDELGVNIPIQLGLAGMSSSSVYTELNGNQYNYIPVRTMGELPYAIPPFLSALEDIQTEDTMIKNLKHIMKQIGLLGFLEILVEQPEPERGESDEDYIARMEKHLQDIGDRAVEGYSRGISVGFKDMYEYKMEGTNMNTNGADKLMDVINRLEFEGMKQDGMFFGRHLQVSEAQSKVLVQIASKQITKVQNVVAMDKAAKASLELFLAGFNPTRTSSRRGDGRRVSLSEMFGLSYEFAPPFELDKKTEEEVRGAKIANVTRERDEGYISQDEAAQQLGYNAAYAEAPRQQQDEGGSASVDNDTQTSSAENERVFRILDKGIAAYKKKFGRGLPVYDYDLPKSYTEIKDGETFFIGFHESELQSQFKRYTNEIVENYLGVYDTARPRIQQRIEAMGDNATAEQLFSAIYFEILVNWQGEFLNKNKDIINTHVSNIYEFYRNDKSIFTADTKGISQFDDIDDAILSFQDFNAIDWLERGDGLYLGKFITDPQTEEKFRTWINEVYLSDNNPVGKSDKFIGQFLDEFGELFAYEAWKIVRVIATTANRARNMANLFYIDQLKVEEYEIVEVMDSRTCDWCRHMNGRVFSVKQSVSWMNDLIASDFADINRIAPFATSTKIDEFTKLNTEELQAANIVLPTFHPHCRGRIVAR